jgi:hypothetical protein
MCPVTSFLIKTGEWNFKYDINSKISRFHSLPINAPLQRVSFAFFNDVVGLSGKLRGIAKSL